MIDVRQVWWIFEADRLISELDEGAAAKAVVPDPEETKEVDDGDC
jgi:hypothetical protein